VSSIAYQPLGGEREQERLARRQHIMDAAEHVFLARGVNGATMDHIAHAAKLSKGALYLYFENKGELYLAIAMRALSELIEVWQDVKEAKRYKSGFELYKFLLEAYLMYALDHRDRFRVTLGWSSAEFTVPKDSEAFAQYQRMLATSSAYGYDALELGKQDGSVRADLNSVSTSFHVWGGTVGMLMLIYAADETNQRVPYPVDLSQALCEHVSALLSNLRHSVPEDAVPVDLSNAMQKQLDDA
jgi:AcrR family transcriptional regulator